MTAFFPAASTSAMSRSSWFSLAGRRCSIASRLRSVSGAPTKAFKLCRFGFVSNNRRAVCPVMEKFGRRGKTMDWPLDKWLN
jgi:hypothetical protein